MSLLASVCPAASTGFWESFLLRLGTLSPSFNDSPPPQASLTPLCYQLSPAALGCSLLARGGYCGWFCSPVAHSGRAATSDFYLLTCSPTLTWSLP